jgi:hypothetical protein
MLVPQDKGARTAFTPSASHTSTDGGRVAEALFDQGLCLPSGSNLSAAELGLIAETVLTTPRRRATAYARTKSGTLPLLW